MSWGIFSLFFLLGIRPACLRPCEWVRVGPCCLRATGAVRGAVATPHNCPALCRWVRAACGLRDARAGHEATARTAPAHPIGPTHPAPGYGLVCLRATGAGRGGCSHSALLPCALSLGPCCLRAFLLEVAFFALPATTPGGGSKNAAAAPLYLTGEFNITPYYGGLNPTPRTNPRIQPPIMRIMCNSPLRYFIS